jgi:transketolase C-terminal domain/subunit
MSVEFSTKRSGSRRNTPERKIAVFTSFSPFYAQRRANLTIWEVYKNAVAHKIHASNAGVATAVTHHCPDVNLQRKLLEERHHEIV